MRIAPRTTGSDKSLSVEQISGRADSLNALGAGTFVVAGVFEIVFLTSWEFAMRTIVVGAVLMLVAVPCFATTQELPTVDEIRSHLRQWRESLGTFRIHYQIKSADSDTQSTTDRDYLLTESHDYLDVEVTSGGWGNPPPRKVISGGNSEKSFNARYSTADDGKTWHHDSLHEDPRHAGRTKLLNPLTQLWLLFDHKSERWLDEYYFDDHRVTVSGRELVDGESCVVLDVTYVYNGEVDGQGARIWLAEDKNFLIKKVTPNPSLHTGRLDADYLCEEFRKTGDHWYPYRGQFLLPPDDSHWEVLDFEVNPPVTEEMFEAPPMIGMISGRRFKPPIVNHQPVETAEPQNSLVTRVAGVLVFVGCLGILAWWNTRRSEEIT